MKKNTKILFGLSLTALTLFSCGGGSSSPEAISSPEKTLDEAQMAPYIEGMRLANLDAVYGNIYLPEESNGKTITWTSSDPTIISDKKEGNAAPGVVTRKAEDAQVEMTASIEIDGVKGYFKQTVTVKGLSKTLTDDDYEGYLFGHFIGEGNENEEQIYFALAEDGLNFKDMNGKQPVLKSDLGEKGVRDPYICRSPEGDRFFLIATDLSIYHRGGWKKNAQGYYDPSTTGSHNLVLWQSYDLVNWGEPTLLPVAPENAGMAWAPEMIFDEDSGNYIIFFASSIMNTETLYKDKPNAIYYCATRDFVHFSDTSLLIDNQTDPDGKAREIIDTTILKVGDYYYSASKDGDNAEANGGIRLMRSRTLLDKDAWEKVLDLDELGLQLSTKGNKALDNSTLEGPEFFVYNKKDRVDPNVPEYGLMADQYAANAGYLPLRTTDLEDRTNANSSWSILSSNQYSFDQLRKRHGTILRVTKDEIERIKENFPI